MNGTPKTLMEAVVHFADKDVAFRTVRDLRWPGGVICPHCGSKKVGLLKTRRIYKCKNPECRKQFSVKVGTIFEDSPLPLDKWLCAMWMLANCKNGVSSYEVHRALGVTQKTAWFMLHRLRLAMRSGSFKKMSGVVEADETFVGGKLRNRPGPRPGQLGRGPYGKSIVFGMLQRDGGVRTWVVEGTGIRDLHPHIHKNLEPGSSLYTDKNYTYYSLGRYFGHESVDHVSEWVRGAVHTNNIECYWSCLKRAIKGTYVSVDRWHLSRYCDEQSFRWLHRKSDDSDRFRQVLSQVAGKRLTYDELTGKVGAAEA